MDKTNIVISCPIDTYSGYGARSRDFVKALIDLNKYDVKILPQRWGSTRWGYLADHGDKVLSPLLISEIKQQPDIWVQITIPNEFQKVGKYNIGVTAGMETDLCDPTWIQGSNRMDLVLASTNHSVAAFNKSKYNMKDNQTGNTQPLELTTKVEVLFEGADLTKYFPSMPPLNNDPELTSLKNTLDSIPESFCYLTTGHWMQGSFGEDRKNIGLTIKAFLETFKNKKNQPALVLKCHSVTTSIMDRERILDKIDGVRKTVNGKLPNIYLIHGEISDIGMNLIYNHSKIKAFYSIPKGEGFGRPFLEFSLVNKPIIASSWSGQTDFLNKDYVRYVAGEVKPVDKSALVKNIIIAESNWFSPDPIDLGRALKDVQKNYSKWLTKAKRQGHYSRTNFSYEGMVDTLKTILETNVPDIPKQMNLSLPKLNLPKLKKAGAVDSNKIILPKLNKVKNTESGKIKLPKLKKL